MNPYRTDALPPPQDTEESTFLPPLEPPPPGTIRYIDIHVYDEPVGEVSPADPESTLEGHPTIVLTHDSQDTQEPTTPTRRPDRTLVPLVLAVVSLLIIIIMLVVMFLLPLFPSTATVTIIPASHEVNMTTTIPLTIGTPSTPGHLAGRALPTITMSQAESIHATGTAHQDAQAAHGLVVFYNAAPYAQTIETGMLLTGADGTQIVTDQDAVIPAGNLATNGQATVSAHALTPGPTGNIQAGDIYGTCCRVNVFVKNAAFSGGTTARDYRTVTKGDITSAVTSLSAGLTQSIQAALHTQVQPSETLVTPLSCTHTVIATYPAGTEATTDHVTMSETCAAMTYLTQEYERLTTAILTKEAQHQLGTGYALIGPIQSTITKITTTHGVLLLHVQVTGTYAYQITQEQQAQIKAAIAGRTKAQATAIVLGLSGVQRVAITTRNGDRLPTDTTQIQVMMMVMP